MRLGKRPHKEDIKAAIRKRGITLAALSLGAELEERTVARALTKPVPSANRAIAAFLGLPLHKLWPDWYDQTGQRIFRQKSPKTTRNSASAHSKKSA